MTMPGASSAIPDILGAIRALDAKLDRVHAAIQGDGPFGTIGLRGRLELVEGAVTRHDLERKESSATLHKRVDGVERRLDRIQWTIAGWAAGGVVGGGGLVALLARLWT